MALVSALLEILQRPTIVDVLSELMMFIAPLWVAVIVGVLVGWAWKPRWAKVVLSKDSLPVSPTTTTLSSCLAFVSIPSLNSLKFQLPNCIPWTNDDDNERLSLSPAATKSASRFVGFLLLNLTNLGLGDYSFF
jgi:hypothetical protein